MFLTKTTEYAIRVLIYMAAKEKEIYTTSLLSKELNIPYKYLSKIMTGLAHNNLVISNKGRGGGFTIALPLNQISIYDIVTAVEGSLALNSCILGFDDCSPENPCALHYIWEENKEALIKTMKETSLEYFHKIRNQIKRF